MYTAMHMGSAHSLLDASTLTRDALVDAEAFGRVPCLIAGDFNMEFEQLHCLYSYFRVG